MNRRVCFLGLALFLSACSGTSWRPVPGWFQARQLVGEGDARARGGDHAGARALYQHVIQEHPSSAWAALALFRLALLQATSESPIRDYRQAYHHFDRLLIEHGESPQAGEARRWRDTLGQLLALEAEIRRMGQNLEQLQLIETEREADMIRLKQELERLTKHAIGLEREAARTRRDLERLKKIDADLEQRRP